MSTVKWLDKEEKLTLILEISSSLAIEYARKDTGKPNSDEVLAKIKTAFNERTGFYATKDILHKAMASFYEVNKKHRGESVTVRTHMGTGKIIHVPPTEVTSVQADDTPVHSTRTTVRELLEHEAFVIAMDVWNEHPTQSDFNQLATAMKERFETRTGISMSDVILSRAMAQYFNMRKRKTA